MEIETEQYLLKDIIDLTSKGQIKSITINNDVVDLLTIKQWSIDELLQADIKISNKYIHFLSKYSFDDLKRYLTHSNNFNTINYKDKYINFELTNHASEQLLKRIIYIYIVNDKFEFSEYFKRYFYYHLDSIVNILHGDKSNINENELVHKIVKDLLFKAEVFTIDNANRRRDKLSFNRRDEENGSTLRYMNHPFLFIVQDSILKTVELYSSSLDCRHLNKVTSGDEFYIWFNNKFKLESE